MLENKYKDNHSLISPSGANRWVKCSASVRLTMDEENRGNKAAQAGTDKHQLCEMLLNGEELVSGRSVVREHEGFDGSKMFYATQPMIDEVTECVRFAKTLATDPSAEIIVEAKVDCIPEYDVKGHIDVTIINGDELIVLDWKFGRGFVEVEENLQLQLYALGAIREHEMFHDFTKVTLHIVQPLIGNSSWETTPEDLADFETWIQERARLALQEDSVCTPSPSACQWCSYAPKCEALFKTASDALDFEDLDSEEAIVGNSEIADIKDITDFMAKRGLIDIAFKAYESRIMDEIKAGKEVEGYKAIKTAKRKAWIDEVSAYDKIKTWLPLDDVAPRKLATPTQVAKMLSGSSTRKLNTFAELWETPEGDIKLVKSSQRGEALKFEQFGDLDA